MNVIEIKDLTKIYSKGRGEVKALDNLTINVPKGVIFGLLGPNGAGKTTLIKSLLGIVHITSGEAKMFGQDIKEHLIRKQIGYLPENHKFPLYMTGSEVIKYSAELSGYKNNDLNSKIDSLLEKVNMTKWKKTKIRKYSKGMLQRIGLAQAMITEPEIIFLDEPTDGVDPIGRKEIRDIMMNLKNEGRTLFLNSHLLSEVELITDRVAILNKGKLVKEGNIDELTSEEHVYKIVLSTNTDQLYSIPNFQFTKLSDNEIKVVVEEEKDIDEVIDRLRAENVSIKSFSQEKRSLETMFMNLIEGENNAK